MNDLAELLAEHVIDPDPTTPYQCACGFLLEFDYNRDTHRAHVAQMVLESDWLRGVRAKELRDAADAWNRGQWSRHYAIPKQSAPVVENWLRDRADRVDAEDFADELPAHIEESMEDPEYAAADALHREAEAAWKSWVPSMFADDENMHTAYVSGYKDRVPRVDAEDGGR